MQELGGSVNDFARQNKVDTTDPKALQAFLSNPEQLQGALDYAGKRAGIIGLADGISGGLASKTIAPAVIKNAVARQAVNLPAQSALQAGFGAGGEAGAQLATKGRIDEPGQILAEAFGEFGGAPLEVAAFAREAAQSTSAVAPATTDIQTLRDTAVAAEREQKKAIADAAITQIGQSSSVDEAIAATQVAVSVPAIGPTEAAVNQERAAEGAVEQQLAAARQKAEVASSKLQRTTKLDDAALVQKALASAGVAQPSVVTAADSDSAPGVDLSTAKPSSSAPAAAVDGQLHPSGAIASGREPARVWFGRRGDGYLTPGDASLALPSRRRESPELEWRMEQQPNGRYRLAGYEAATALTNPEPISAPPAKPTDPSLIPLSNLGPTTAAYRALAAEKAGNPDLFNADLAKELFPEYNGANSAALSDRASVVRDAAFQERLAQPAQPGEVVTLTAGGTGSGKSTTVPNTGIVYDSTLGKQDPQKVFDLIDGVLATGRDVDLNYVFTDPEVALVRAVRRAQDIGRTLTIDTHLKTHRGANATARAVQERYAGDGRVEVKAFDNTGSGPVQVDEIPTYDYNTAGEKLQSTLDAERNAGRIDDALYSAFSGAGAQRTYGQDGDASAGGARPQALGLPPVDVPRTTAQPPGVLTRSPDTPQTPAFAGVSVSAPELTYTKQRDGTVLVKGSRDAIRAALPDIGGIAGRSGVMFGRSQAEAVAKAIDTLQATQQNAAQPTPSPDDQPKATPQRKPEQDDGEPPFFSRESAGPSPGLSRAQFSAAMANAFGKSVAARLEQKGVVVAVERQESLPARVAAFLRDGDTIFGVYDPVGDKTFVVLENINEGMVRELALHEIGVHYGFKRMLGDEKYAQVMRRIDAMRRAKSPAVQDAYLNAKKNAARESQIPEETLAYLVQNAPDLGLVQEVVGKIKAFLFREFGIGATRLTEADLSVLASAAVRHASRSENVLSRTTNGAPAYSRTSEPELALSAQRDPAASGYTLDPEGFWLKQRRMYQDYFIRMKQVQDAVRKQGGTISEATDTYMAEELGYGRVQEQIKEFGEKAVRPMVDAAQKADIGLDELALYAYAKHAPERNAAIAGRNSRFADGGSGMTDAEAKAIVDRVKADGKEAEYEDLRQRLMGMTQATRLIQLDEGLITPEEYQALQAAYQDYVPLRGFERVDEDDKPTGRGTGKGWQVRGKENMRALGRSSKAGQVIENIIADYERAIVRAERNHIGKVFLNFVQANPDPTLWEVDAEKTKQAYDRQTGKVAKNTIIDKGDDTIGVKLNGQEVFVKIKDPTLARALNEKWKDDYGATGRLVSNSIGLFTSLLRNVYTRFNPEFAITNAVRDFEFGTAAVLDALGEKGVLKFAAHYKGAMSTGFRAETGRIDSASPEWRRYFTEYRAAGGTTGGFYTKDTEEIQADIRGMLIEAGSAPNTIGERLRFNSATRLTTKALRVLELAGATSEHAARVAAYRTAREMGKTPSQAASIAKNLTVNFNRKGEYGQLFNTFYLFYNASVQGTVRLAQMLKNPKVLAYATAFTAATSSCCTRS